MPITLSFRNLTTGELRTLEAHVRRGDWTESPEYMLHDSNGNPIAESAPTEEQAIENGAMSYVPEMAWGWRDVKRYGTHDVAECDALCAAYNRTHNRFHHNPHSSLVTHNS